ncbi:MAG TPA: inositol monophosphatase family protein [Candidatus Binatia bacterium]|nr:inositol monophosphatase family protein [Candidatus Binatia bacterium]
MTQTFSAYLDAAWQAADAAGEIIHANWHKPKTLGYKGAVDLVTDTDRRCERTIVGILTKHFPEHSILAEEETRLERHENSYRWIVDPLDGTTNFAHGYPHVCVSIALERDGEVVLGLVYDPLRREVFQAVKDHGATLNGQTIRCSAVDDMDQALIATGFPYDRREHPDYYLSYFKAFLTRCQGIRRNGAAALDLCYVACGRIDGYWELKLKPWDVAAGSLIVAEAGGQLSDFHGRPFDIRGSETLATNKLLHAQMARIVAAIATERVD